MEPLLKSDLCVQDEWIITTPDEGAIKWWIGNAAEDGKAGTVFARLKIPVQEGKRAGLVDHGVHAFVIFLRDASGKTLPGVEIKDCGYKVSITLLDEDHCCKLGYPKALIVQIYFMALQHLAHTWVFSQKIERRKYWARSVHTACSVFALFLGKNSFVIKVSSPHVS